MPDLRELTARFAGAGTVKAIIVRPGRDEMAVAVSTVQALAGRGLEGDRSAQRASTRPGGGKRQVTLVQAEHLPVLASLMGRAEIDPLLLRRNLVIAGINLLAARTLFADRPVRVAIGSSAIVVFTGPCDPCSKMEDTFGPGAYNALRGHGGITARIEVSGPIEVGDPVRILV